VLTKGSYRNNPLYPPYFKGEIEEGETPCVLEGMLKEIGESGVVYEVG
jgi:hypothetical protein